MTSLCPTREITAQGFSPVDKKLRMGTGQEDQPKKMDALVPEVLSDQEADAVQRQTTMSARLRA